MTTSSCFVQKVKFCIISKTKTKHFLEIISFWVQWHAQTMFLGLHKIKIKSNNWLLVISNIFCGKFISLERLKNVFGGLVIKYFRNLFFSDKKREHLWSHNKKKRQNKHLQLKRYLKTYMVWIAFRYLDLKLTNLIKAKKQNRLKNSLKKIIDTFWLRFLIFSQYLLCM